MPGRGNGLRATSYAPLIELSPQLADAMLEALRERGIAAYVTPTPGVGDRLYVDASAKDLAQRVLHTLMRAAQPPAEQGDEPNGMPGDEPGGAAGRDARGQAEHRDAGRRDPGDEAGGASMSEEDEAWQRIVDAFDTEPSGDMPPWPASEDLPDTDDSSGGPPDGSEGSMAPGRLVKSASGADRAEGDDDDHFIPPPPPPLPRTDPVTKWAWLALFGGPAYLLLAAMFGWDVPGWAAFGAVASFVGGFVTLVVRMGDDPPRDSGPDDGAVV